MRLFDSVGRPAVLLLGALGVAAVGALDLATEEGLAVFPLHLVPVSFVSWRLGRREGVGFALLSTAACLAAAPLPRMELSGLLAGAWNLGAHGHDVGDEILRTVAVSLRSAIRSTDLAARVGGDDFVLLLPETDRRGAQVILEKCLHRLQQDMARGGWPVTVSLGSISSIEAVDGESLSRQADQLLAQVKGAGETALRAGNAAPASSIP